MSELKVPANRGGTLWTVFELNGSTITPINTMSYESDPSIVREIDTFTGRAFETDAVLMRNLPNKR